MVLGAYITSYSSRCCGISVKGQLQRFDELSLFDRFRHVENGFDIIF